MLKILNTLLGIERPREEGLTRPFGLDLIDKSARGRAANARRNSQVGTADPARTHRNAFLGPQT